VVAESTERSPARRPAKLLLLGAIWQPWSSKNIWFDAGVRRGLSAGVADWQFTLGLTFGFSVSSLNR